MKPAPFAYVRPRTLAEALEVYAACADAKILAGGQSLVPLMSMRLASPAVVVDINGLPELAYVRSDETGVSIGALARHAQVEGDTGASRTQPLLGQALRRVAHPTIRNRGTPVGSLVHADAAAELPVVWSLLGGSVTAESVGASRQVGADTLYVGPLETSLGPDEIVTEAWAPALPAHAGTAFDEIARRHGDYALCGVAALVGLDDSGTVRSVRAGYLSVGDTAVVLDLSAAFAAGVDPDALAQAAQLARDGVDPQDDIHASADYRRQLAGVLTARVVSAAYTAAKARGAQEPTGQATCHRESAPGRAVTVTSAPAESASADAAVREVRLRVNGAIHAVRVPPRRLLSDALRHDCGLTGTHVGCEHGVCGACTVLLDGRPVRSCLLLAVSAQDAEITTVEGLAKPDGTLGPVQQAFKDCHGLQCGFCTPGFLTTVAAGLEETPEPDVEAAREMIGGNLCRCTGYQNIVKAVLRAAELRGGQSAAELPAERVPR
ncbi:MAG: FAD binding domain-containing protein [Nocardioidaceae bacterium]